MRAKTKIYHIKCFKCSACERQLKPGDEFALREGGALYCKNDHDQIERMKTEEKSSCQLMELNMNQTLQSPDKKVVCNIKKRTASSDFGSISGKKS
jgi:insulin gene enhancer protein ISL-1